MKTKKMPVLYGLCFLGCTVHVYAQQAPRQEDTLTLSLPEAWQRAEAHSRFIDISKKTSAIAAESVKDARMERYPELGIKSSVEKATNIPVYENGLFSRPVQHEVIHTLYRVSTDFYLDLYNGNKLNLKIEAEKTLYQISRIREEQAVSDIRYKTAALYLELQKALVFRNLVREDIIDQEKQLKEVRAFHKNGTVLKSDVLRVELELSRRKMALVTIENDILIATQKLNILIGEPDERILVPAALATGADEATGYEQYLATALQHAFAWHISEQQTALSRINLRQVKANIRPRLGMYGEFYYANPQIFLYPYNPYWYSLGVAGLKASFPLSALYHNVHKVRAAKLELEREETLHKDTEDKIRQQVKEAYLRYKEALVQIRVAEVNVGQAEENARIIKNTYFSQAALVTDLLDADIQVLQTRFELAAARIMAQNKYYLLQNTTGVL